MSDLDTFVDTLVELVDPRTDEDTVTRLVGAMDREDLERSLVAVAASLTGYIDGEAFRLEVDMESYMQAVRRHFRRNIDWDDTSPGDALVHEGGLFT